jgi:excisionase family DNA binding protein
MQPNSGPVFQAPSFFENQRLLTAKDVAALLRCSLQHVYNMVWRDEIPFVKIGGLLRFRKERLIEWLNERS